MTVAGSGLDGTEGLDGALIETGPVPEIRRGLVEIFAEALSLEIDDVAVDRPFFEIATSSLALVSALKRVSDAFGVRPSLRRVFEEFGTIDRLAGYLAELVGERPLDGMRDARTGRPPVEGDRLRLNLNTAQQELVFLGDLRPEAAAAWRETLVVELQGALRLDALRSAVTALARRHEALRARLTDDRRALSIDLDPSAIDLRVGDLTASSDAGRLSETAGWLRSASVVDPLQSLVRFDLARFPYAPWQHVLRVTAHGLIADRAAVIRFVEELGALYTAESGGASGIGLPPAESLASHQSAEAAAALDPGRLALVEFWRANLASLPVTDLPADRARPPIKRYAGDRIVVPIEPALLERVRVDGGAIGAFLHVVAGVAAWTARLSGESDIVIGVFAQPLDGDAIVANRTNPLPIRVIADDRVTFDDLKRAVSAAFLDAVDHGELPFADIVRAVNPGRDQGRSPIFTVAVDREVWPSLQFGDLGARIVTAPSQHARYDLALTLVEGPGFAHLRCDYSTELFEKTTVRRYLTCLRRLLDRSLSDASCAIGSLPLLGAEDRARIVDTWNRTVAAAPEDEALFVAIERQAARTPNADAIVDGDRRMSYGELTVSSNKVANQLRRLGVEPEARVAILMRRSPEAIVAMLGVLKAGGAYVFVDPQYPPARVEFMLSDAGANVLVTDAGLRDSHIDRCRAVLGLSPDLPELAVEREEAPGVVVGGSSLAYVMYTSGSTGVPKGAAIEHRSAVNLVSWARAEYTAGELAGVLASTSFCFDPSIFEIFVPLSCGGAVIVAENLFDLPAAETMARVTLVQGVPSAVRQLTELARLPAHVRVVNLGGEPISQELVDRIAAAAPGCRVVNQYGVSEATTCSTATTLAPGADGAPGIGRPIANTRVYVLDRQDQPVPAGVAGELCIAGRGLARGYLGKPELTHRSFVDDPFIPGERMYRTGDRARFRDDGSVEFLGRRDQQVKVRGFRLELGELEACLLHHPAVRETVVLAVGDEADRRLVAWFVPADGVPLPDLDLRAYLVEHLPVFMIPSAFVELPVLPRLPNGKIDRGALPAPAVERESRITTEYAAPSTPIERTLGEIWSERLGVERLGRDDDFFELGGHSLLIAPILLEIHRRLGVRLTLSEFFEAPTVAMLAARVQALNREGIGTTSVRRRARIGPEVDAYFDALRADAVLDPRLEMAASAAGAIAAPSHVLVTGVTGFVGVYVFHELLRQGDARFACLARSTDADDGRRRIVAAMKRHDLWDPSFEDRFTVVPGDLTRPRCGMSRETYDRLTRECDAVVHLAAQVNFVYPYRALKAANVDGVHEVLRFCFAGGVKPFHYVSTAAIWPMGSSFFFREDDDINHGVRLNIGYDDSKWVAEHLVQQARLRGLGATIYRPGEVAGHSVTGRCALDHFMWAIVKGSIQMKVFPEMKSRLDIAPIDYVAAAIATLVMDPRAAGGTYHLNNPRPADPASIYDCIREYGYAFTIQETDAWIATLLARDDLTENALYPFVAILEEFEAENFQLPTCDTTRARAALHATGVECPPVDSSLLRRYLDYLVEVGFLHPPCA